MRGFVTGAAGFIGSHLAAEAISCRHAISLPSFTAGIHLALMALGIGPGDEVVVQEITWIASAAPISYVGATPAFAFGSYSS